MIYSYKVHCERGHHPYEPIVGAETPTDAIKQVKAKFGQMYGKGMYGHMRLQRVRQRMRPGRVTVVPSLLNGFVISRTSSNALKLTT